MPATTPVYALPYPVPADTVDVPRDIKALADKVDTFVLRPPLVAALPGSPTDAQEVYYQSAGMATDGIVWHLRYRLAALKWEFVGGAAIIASDPTNRTIANATYNPIAAVPVGVTVPLIGEYRCEAGAIMYNSANGQTCFTAIRRGAAGAVDADGWRILQPAASAPVVAGGTVVLPNVSLAAGANVTLEHKATNSDGRVESRWLKVTPLRVG